MDQEGVVEMQRGLSKYLRNEEGPSSMMLIPDTWVLLTLQVEEAVWGREKRTMVLDWPPRPHKRASSHVPRKMGEGGREYPGWKHAEKEEGRASYSVSSLLAAERYEASSGV